MDTGHWYSLTDCSINMEQSLQFTIHVRDVYPSSDNKNKVFAFDFFLQ